MIHTFSRKNIEIATGVAQGVPIPLAMRWQMVFLLQVPATGFMGAFHLIMAFAFRTIGQNVDVGVRTLAQMCVYVYGLLGVMILIFGPWALVGIASLLREEKRD